MSEEEINHPEQCSIDLPDFVLDNNLRQVLVGDYVWLPCWNSIVDRGMVLSIRGSKCEIMILSPETGIPETLVIDFRYPDPSTEMFGRYGYLGIQICARKGEPLAVDFVKQLLAACEEMARQVPKFNVYMMLQANARLEYLNKILS